eukprot:1598131-Rhodomonas_salina.3
MRCDFIRANVRAISSRVSTLSHVLHRVCLAPEALSIWELLVTGSRQTAWLSCCYYGVDGT